jgi:hypothetical protein
MRFAWGVLAILPLPLFGQAQAPVPSPVDQKRVEAAIQKGAAFLKTAVSPSVPWIIEGNEELLLWSFVHAGVPEDDPRFQSLLKKMLASRLERTYSVCLQAMILEELDRVKYQGRIAQCAQFLLDNQCRNGQWSYGEPSPHADHLATMATKKESAADPDSGRTTPTMTGRRTKPRVLAKLKVTKKRDGPDVGCNSNAQYAALGLRACFDAGILLPQEAISLARKWWVDSQYAGAGAASGDARGWCYRYKGAKECRAADRPYASMTAGGVGALAIYDFILGKNRKSDPSILKGLAWLTKNYSITEHIGPCENSDEKPAAYLYYYFYALERAGTLCGIEQFGAHEWYSEGAALLLAAQRADGSWKGTHMTYADPTTWDTCFAILFLRRATRPLEDVASEDKFLKTDPASEK